MRRFGTALLLLVLFSPVGVYALQCTQDGYTIIYVNGVFGTEDVANKDKRSLEQRLHENSSKEDVAFVNGYNPSHVAGITDIIQSLAQAFNASISNYDLDTILMQIHPQVTTRKILLVGHSQGAFYTNEMYGYLTQHGVSKESIAVYNLATPASYVAGGGQYITSTNDKVINDIRDKEIRGNRDVYLNSYYTVGDVVASLLP